MELLTFCPERGLLHYIVHNVPQQPRTDPGRDLRVTVVDDLHVLLRPHHFEIARFPVVRGLIELDNGSGHGAYLRGPDAGEGGNRLAHNAFCEERRQIDGVPESIFSMLVESAHRRLVVADESACSVSGFTCDVTEREEMLPSLTNECLAPQMVQQLDGARSECTRKVQECHYVIRHNALKRPDHHLADVVPDGDS